MAWARTGFRSRKLRTRTLRFLALAVTLSCVVHLARTRCWTSLSAHCWSSFAMPSEPLGGLSIMSSTMCSATRSSTTRLTLTRRRKPSSSKWLLLPVSLLRVSLSVQWFCPASLVVDVGRWRWLLALSIPKGCRKSMTGSWMARSSRSLTTSSNSKRWWRRTSTLRLIEQREKSLSTWLWRVSNASSNLCCTPAACSS